MTVRLDHSTFRVTIRDASAPLSTIKATADQFSSVRRCEKTGEILCGANTFVDVQHMDELVAPVAASVVTLLMLPQATPGQGEFSTVNILSIISPVVLRSDEAGE